MLRVCSEVPEELEEICRKEWPNMQDVGISLVDKSAEAFTPPKPKFDFAKSQGQSLGGAGAAASAAASAQSFADAAPRRLEVDASQPTTTLQLVMGGKKVRETANQDTTVMQLYQHFMSSVHKLTKCTIGPAVHRLHRALAHFALSVLACLFSLSGLSGFELVAGFPPKPLTNPALTLKEAGLLNGSITQRGG